MLLAYRRLPIPTKLVIAAISMLIPLGSLTFFMEIGFRYDINIAKMEMAGTKCLREAFRIQHFLSNHHMISLIEALPDSKTGELEIETAHPDSEIEDALTRLTSLVKAPNDGQSKESSFATDPLSCVELSRMRESWKWYSATGRPASLEDATQSVLGLITQIANCANLALDPALDSQMLARATVNILPQSSTVMSHMQQTALALIATHPPHTVVPLTKKIHDDLIGAAAYYKDGLLKRLLDDSAIAMAEDANYYTYSPTLTLHYGTTLSHYQKSATLLLEVISRMDNGQASPTELFNAAARVRSAGFRLFSTAMDEMDILLQKRIDGYQTWRLLGAGCSAAGLLTAILFLMAASGSISRGIQAVNNYIRSIARGDYDTKLDTSDLGPRLRSMAHDTDAMVSTLKDQISYLDGILRGMTVPCFMVDRDERITYVNQPAVDLAELTVPPAAVIGQKLALLVYGDPGKPTVTGRCMQQNISIKDELLDLKTPTGTVRHIRFDVAPLTGPDGEVTGAFAVVTDLTDMVEKEKNIERLAAFTREAPDPILSAGSDGAILYLNTSAAIAFESSGIAPDQNFLPEGHTEIVASCLATGNSRHGIESRIGTSSYSWTYHPLVAQQIVHMYATDITKRIRAEEQLLHDAFHDSLTGLPNKALFLDRVSQAFRRARRRDARFAVLFLDLDGFKNVNDGLGHNVGDKLLARIAWRIKRLLGPDETLARLGGDEFTILMPMINDDMHGLQLANSIQDDLKSPFEIDGNDLFISASIGIINAPDGANDASDLLRDAETAMYRAKSLGRARSEVFNPTMHKDASERIQMENDLKRAVEKGEFEPYYQPIISLADGHITGFEALIRWRHPLQGIISPARFIPLAEETGLIVPMGAFMLEAACRQTKLWQERYHAHRDLTISVNMSVVQMNRPTISSDIKSILEYTGIAPNTVKIEITESGLMNNVGLASDLLKKLEAMGISLMIDDFGTGYSSLSHLHQFPFHYLKIDQSFVSTMEDKPDNMEIVRSIISLAHTLGKQVVAEGVETESQRILLRKLGCEFVQGYRFSQPLPAGKAEVLLGEEPDW